MKKLMLVALISLAVVVQVKAGNDRHPGLIEPLSCEYTNTVFGKGYVGSYVYNYFDYFQAHPELSDNFEGVSEEAMLDKLNDLSFEERRSSKMIKWTIDETEGYITIFFGNRHCPS